MLKKVNVFFKKMSQNEKIKNNVLFLLLGITLIGVMLVYSLNAGHYVDFYPTNGTFQNFNPVRRFLSGQVPYRDFTDYLGLGHLYLGSFVTWILGSSFKASLIAFTFLTVLSFALIAFAIAYCFFSDKLLAISIAIMIVLLDFIRPVFGFDSKVFNGSIISAFNASLGPGNSARFIRSMILPLSILLFLIFLKWAKKRSVIIKKISNRYVYAAAIGTIGGLSFLWSNDYGISCFVCLIVMTAWVALAKYKKIGIAMICASIEVLSSIISIGVFATIFSFGNFKGWSSFIAGSGGYQMWYYNAPDNICYIFDLELGIFPLIQAALCIVYLILIFKNSHDNRSLFKYSILAYLNMTCFCAVNEYRLISSGELYEYANVVLILIILFELLYLMKEAIAKYRSLIGWASLVLGFIFIISVGRDEFMFKYMSEKEGAYIEALDGYNREFSEDLLKTYNFLQGKEVFATYSTAQDVMNDNFQPSGTDYIIHVLGDESRENYLEAFNNRNFEYVSTINKEYNVWEVWVERANWFFYRELYKNWHPVYINTYEVYWEMNDYEDNYISFEGNVDVSASDNKVTLQIECDESVNGIADVYIDYEVEKGNSKFAKLAFKTLLNVKEISDYDSEMEFYHANNLRAKGAEYIPVKITNGIGCVELTSVPEKCTNITLNDVKVGNIYPVLQQYIKVKAVSLDDEGNYYLNARNSGQFSESMLYDISFVEIDGAKYRVNEIAVDGIKVSLYIGDILEEEAEQINDYLYNESNMIRIY